MDNIVPAIIIHGPARSSRAVRIERARASHGNIPRASDVAGDYYVRAKSRKFSIVVRKHCKARYTAFFFPNGRLGNLQYAGLSAVQ